MAARLLSTRQVADLGGVTERTVRVWVSRGWLNVHRRTPTAEGGHGRMFFRYDDVRKTFAALCVEEQQQPERPARHQPTGRPAA
jgi:DNA-binding transcriptional MerR regulator